MRKFLLLTFLIFSFLQLRAQTPQAINYQGVVRDANGDPISNSTVNVRFTIREANPTGTIVFQEFHIVTTNVYGLISLPIGQGSATQGFFNQINWDQNTYYLQVEAHPGSPPYVDLGTTQFLSVPYAQAAKIAESVSIPVDLTPPGVVVPFAGNVVPNGWLLCDGSEVSRTTYSALFTSLGFSWGFGDGINTFNLPDLRGRFLRGVDQGAGNDPDIFQRDSLYTFGNSGDTVGSYQDDAQQGHRHTIGVGRTSKTVSTNGNIQYPDYGNAANGPGTTNDPVTDGINGTPRISSENRPKNANIYFIIKY